MFDFKTRILVVDDMSMMRKAVGKFCREIGFTDITEAVDGIDAWAKTNEASPPFGLIISDWNMPNCTGLDFKKSPFRQSLRKNPLYLGHRKKEKDQVIEALKAGVTGYVVKPFTPQVLREKIEEVRENLPLEHETAET